MLDKSWRHYITSLSNSNDYKSILGEILAIMNGDGGHFQDKHGVDEAVFDAMKKWYSMKEKID